MKEEMSMIDDRDAEQIHQIDMSLMPLFHAAMPISSNNCLGTNIDMNLELERIAESFAQAKNVNSDESKTQ